MPSFNTISYTNKANLLAAAHNIDPTGTKTSAMTDQEINFFLSWADSIINSKLSPVAFVPLRQIIRNGITNFPDPIEFIATNLAAGYCVESLYSRIEPETSESGKVHKENALKYLDDLCNGVMIGSIRLDGQELKARNSFANPFVAPLEQPKPSNF